MAKKTTPEAVLEVPVAYSNVSIGDLTARIGLTIDRGNLNVAKADRTVCCKRLQVSLRAMSNGAQPGQESLPGLDGGDWEFDGVADVKGFAATGKKISLGLTFALASVDVEILAHFAKRQGWLVVKGVEELPDDEDEEGD